VVFLLADDQRFDTIHALGNGEIVTPTLDSLCGCGTSFTRAHIMGGTQGAVCVPSRAMLLTGRNLFSLEDTGNTIPANHTTMPEAFRAAGYRTCGIGKWHNGRPSYARSFTDGAQIYFGGMADHFRLATWDFDPEGKYPKDAARVREGHSSELLASAAADFITNQKDDKPFFLYVAALAPHDPRTAPAEYTARYRPEELSIPKNFAAGHPFNNGELKIRDELLAPFPRTPEAIRRHIADYYAMITHLDAQLAKIIQALDGTGRRENTIIVFAGDNGLALGQHGLMGKQNLYECSLRVPLLMSGPGMEPNARRDTLCCLQDVFPTLCQLTGIDTPASVEGKSLKGALKDKGMQVRDHVFYAYRDVQRGVSDGRWKLIEYSVGGTRTTQLFDLDKDPLEMNNLAADTAHEGELSRMRALLRKSQDEMHDPQRTLFEEAVAK
jgi:arylsulfatase A-like enzyme